MKQLASRCSTQALQSLDCGFFKCTMIAHFVSRNKQSTFSWFIITQARIRRMDLPALKMACTVLGVGSSCSSPGPRFILLNTHLFIKVLQSRDSEETFSVFESSCHLLLPVQPLKGRGNPVKCLAQGHSKRTYRSCFTLTLLNAERQAGNL